MKRNKNIVILFTVVFLAAVIINILPNRNDETKKVTVFSDLSSPQMNLTLQNVLNKYNISVTNSTNWRDSSDVKLKYASAVTVEEKAMYDIYNLKEESLYSVGKKGFGKKLGYSDVQKYLNSSENSFNNDILLFTPNTSHWFDSEKTNGKVYIYDRVGKIINDDETVTGILFESEIDNMSNYDVNIINKDNNEIKDALSILIKKSVFKKDTEEKIYSDLKKNIDNLKGESNGK
ncbi:hypothetical protein [Clostridium folliculivorans]|uniref:Uncharacterized protein n=1 Tax=Clostridium folliculivorans TaxID=2886038 RepID=A0A9W5Y555_9CLOT|nr:hypothetical protein [Clostridium folliculivorans]GKU26916.1 hypothetical protein CFOLD11_37430 [Clostridium folliculivorans]GKU31567.1 hypothetical protein CFB3_36740 [Clostridium folliculivorans]